MPVAVMTLDEEKRALRKRMRAMRLVADQKFGPDAALGLIRSFMPNRAAVGIAEGSIVGGYWPIITEIDIRPLMAKLEAMGAACALPVLVASDQPMIFRRWRPEDPVEEGEIGTFHPGASSPEVVPDFLLVPLIAFDDEGWRLGQGGGHFDRTLAAIKQSHPVVAVGVAYAAQRVERVPRSDHDQRMDWILTEQAMRRTGS